MALSSGALPGNSFREKFDKAEFSHAPSGVAYRVTRDANETLLNIDLNREDLRVQTSRRLEYFIGSGRVGRSYLFSWNGFLYQAPVSYYASESKWDISPGYRDYDYLHLTRPVEPACLQCHASRLQPLAGTVNGYAAPPFLEGGVGCERCHGPGEDHIRRAKAGGLEQTTSIVNPKKLSPDRRDSVCTQCHVTGVARIDKSGIPPGAFQPGALLRDYVSIFVWSGAAEMKVTSHVEKLAQSHCKIASGDRMWCGSCHDPHSTPDEDQRAGWFRTKCLECHAASAPCKAPLAVRTRKANDCTACHMPRNPVADVDHASYTDHSIPRRTVTRVSRPVNVLAPLDRNRASDRDLGLAYALVVEGGRNPAYEARAFELLKASVRNQPGDVPAMVRLAQLYGYRDDHDNAIVLYEKALQADPSQVVAATNLGVYRMQQGRTSEAIRLWSGALKRSPGLETARMNLAVAQFRAGDIRSAQQTLIEGLDLNPGATAMRSLSNRYRQSPPP